MIEIFDTETTGLPVWNEPSEGENQPHIVQIGIIQCNDDRSIVQQIDKIIRPDGWIIPDEVAAIHGITTERAMDEGIPEKDAVEMFIEIWRAGTLRIGHNISFDDRIIRIALKRYFSDQLADEYKEAPKFCTGHQSKGILKLPAPPKARRYGPYKMPKLEEAYKFFTGKDLENAHSAMADALATMDVYWGIQDHKPTT